MIALEILWYLVIGLAAAFYVVLDGFDLGVGMLHLFTKVDEERRIFLNSIGPVWDGNELWLVIVGGALFAGFPDAYATLFSSFYTIAMVALAALLFRSAAIEFRSKRESARWRRTWDTLFSFASYLIAFGLGVVLGNLIEGIALGEQHIFEGRFVDFLSPYPLLVGLLSVSLFMMHGLLYLLLKTEGSLNDKLHRWVGKSVLIFIVIFLLVTLATISHVPYMMARLGQHPLWLLVPLAMVICIFNIPWQASKFHNGKAFISSSLSIVFLFLLYGIGTFPVLVRSRINPANFSLSIKNTASSELTLKILLFIVIIGVPLILAYGFFVYRIFRGKVKLDKSSY